jgi:hypothetical protein
MKKSQVVYLRRLIKRAEEKYGPDDPVLPHLRAQLSDLELHKPRLSESRPTQSVNRIGKKKK